MAEIRREFTFEPAEIIGTRSKPSETAVPSKAAPGEAVSEPVEAIGTVPSRSQTAVPVTNVVKRFVEDAHAAAVTVPVYEERGISTAQAQERLVTAEKAPVARTAPEPPPELLRQPAGRYVDDFIAVVYDIGYRSEPEGSLSKWLQVTYADGAVVDISIDEIFDESMTPDESERLKRRGRVGNAGRLFPERMNSATAPRLAAAKQEALRTMDDYNALFIMMAFPAVWHILVTAGTAGLGFGQLPKATRRPLPIREGPPAPRGNPQEYGQALGDEVRSMPFGRRLAIAQRVSDAKLSHADAVTATDAAARAAFGRTGPPVRLADGSTVVIPAAIGHNQPVFVVRPTGAVFAARATITPRGLALSVTNIVKE